MRKTFEKEDVLIFCHYADFNSDGSSRLLSPLEEHFRSREIRYRKYALPSRATARSDLPLDSVGALTFLWAALWRLSARHFPKNIPLQKFFSERARGRLKNILERHSPQLVIHTGEFLPLSVASHQLDTRSCEILHGRDYEKIDWGYDTRERTQLPTDIICFDEKSLKTFSPLNKKSVKIHKAKSQLPVKMELTTQNLSRVENQPIHILVAGQWGNGFVSPIQGSNKMLEDLAKHVHHNTRQCQICYVPHPVQLATRKFAADLKHIYRLADHYQQVVCPSYTLELSSKNRYVCLGFDSGLMTDLRELGIPSANLEAVWFEIRRKYGVDCFEYLTDISEHPSLANSTENVPSVAALIDSFLSA